MSLQADMSRDGPLFSI